MATVHWSDVASTEVLYGSLREFFLGPLAAAKRANPAVRRVTDSSLTPDTPRIAILLFLYLAEIAIGLVMFLLLWLVSFSIQSLVGRVIDSSRTNSVGIVLAFVTVFFLLSFLARSTVKLIKRI